MATSNGKKVQNLNDDMNDQLTILRDDIATLTSTISELAKAQGAQLRAVANDKVDELTTKGAETAGEAREMASKKLAETEDAVKANPAAAMGIAAGAGFLVGLLLSRRS